MIHVTNDIVSFSSKLYNSSCSTVKERQRTDPNTVSFCVVDMCSVAGKPRT